MSDNDQKQYAERGTKGAPSGESAHADRTPPKGVEGELANFQKWKSRREAGEGDTSPKKSDPEGDSDETTAADPEKSDQNETGNLSGDETHTADGSGKATDDDDSSDGELPPWMKRRLERANKRAEAMEKRAAELRDKLAEQSKKPDETPKEDDGPTATEDSGVYDFDYPVEDDYKDAKGQVDEEAYLLDVKNWHEEKPLVGGKSAKSKQQAKPQQQKQESQGDTPEEYLALVLSSLEEAFDDAKDAPKNLFDDFLSQAKRGSAKISMQMLDWMADHEPEAILLATEFVERPRRASNIFRKPASQHRKLLSDLAKDLKSEKAKAKKEPPLEDGTKEQTAANLDRIKGRRQPDPDKTFRKAQASSNYRDFATARSASERQARPTNVANLF